MNNIFTVEFRLHGVSAADTEALLSTLTGRIISAFPEAQFVELVDVDLEEDPS